MRQGQQTALARRIGLCVRLRLPGAGRGQIDDGTAVSAQVRRTVLGQQHRPTEVHRQHPIPVSQVEAFQGDVVRIGNRCVAYQRIQAPELAEHLGHPKCDLPFIRDIHGDEPSVIAQHFRHFRTALPVQIRQHDLPAFADQPGRDPQANAPRSTGHQRYAAI
ncbi:hypothetical protein D3C87_857990 [compost metagenome]